MNIKLCCVCGARARWGTTCDSTCTRAKRNGLTRGQQMNYDLKRMKIEIRFLDQARGENHLRVDEIHYNRPYLSFAYAG